MKKRNRLLATFLALAMILSMVPTMVFAAEEVTYTQVTSLDEITAGGDFLIVAQVDTDYFLMKTSADYNWIDAESVTVSDDSIVDSDGSLPTWKVEASTNGVTLSSGSGEYLYSADATSANLTLASTQTEWTVAKKSDASTFTFTLYGGTRKITYRSGTNFNRFRAYTNDNTEYFPNLLIFKEGTGAPVTQVATPTASVDPGVVRENTSLTFVCSTENSKIYYNTTSERATFPGDWTEYTTALTLTADTTYYVKATDNGATLTDSAVATFAYTILAEQSIATVRAEPKDTLVKTTGVVSYINGRNAYIQTITGDKGIALYYSATPSSPPAIGQEVTVIGTMGNYNSLLQINVVEADVIKGATGQTLPTPPAVTLAGLASDPLPYESIRVALTGVTIGTWSGNHLNISQDGGSSISIYYANALNLDSSTIYEGCTADLIAVVDVLTAPAYRLRVAAIGDITNIQAATKVNAPTANPAGGRVLPGTEIEFASTTPGAAFSYSLDGSAWVTGTSYTIPGDAVVDSTIELKVKATKASLTDSEITTLIYTVKAPLVDPIPDNDPTVFTDGVLNTKEAIAATKGHTNSDTVEVKVAGQLVYRYGAAASTNTVILQDVIDGVIYSYQVFGDTMDDCALGDIVVATGNAYMYGSAAQIGSGAAHSKIRSGTLMAPEVYDTFAEMKGSDNEDARTSRYVKIPNVVLGATTGRNTRVTDSDGGTMDIYDAAAFQTGVAVGDTVDLYAILSRYNATWQFRTGLASSNENRHPYVVTIDNAPPVITLPDSWMNAEVGIDYKVSVTIADNVGVDTATVSYTVGATTSDDNSMTYNSVMDKYEFTIPGSALVAAESSFTLTITAKDASGNTTTSTPATITIIDEPRIVNVSPAINEETLDQKQPTLSVTFENAGAGATVVLTLTASDGNDVVTGTAMAVVGDTATWAPGSALTDGKYTATVTITRTDTKSLTYSWRFFVGEAFYTPYFGQLHSHTTYSDGAGSLPSALDYIRDTASRNNVQFVAFTDHSNYFDNSGGANPEAALYDMTEASAYSNNLWSTYKDTIAQFNAANSDMIALGGFEMTWSGGPGHINTFNTPGIVSRNNTTLNSKTADAGLKAYYELLKDPAGADSISMFNHPGTTFGTFADFAYWDPLIDSRVSLIEVGNGEGQIGAGGYYPSYEHYTTALDKGWHVAPTNNQDNHKGKWGDANDARTVIITDDFSENGLYEGMREMNMYATEDKNLDIMYTVNGLLMGSSIDEATELNFDINISDPDIGIAGDKISTVEVIANSGRIVFSETGVDSHSYNKTDLVLDPDYTYYYLRVTQADGNIAVTAPVWVGDPLLFGITTIETDTSNPVTEEALTLKTTMFNSESSNITLRSMTYAIVGGSVIHSSTPNTVITPNSSYTHTINYTPTLARDLVVEVTAVLRFDGVDYTFTKNITLEVLDSTKMVYIAIDASHHNEYVNGNYKDSMGNFGLLAAQYNARTMETKTSADLIAACSNEKVVMLVLNVPSRRDGTALRNPYDVYSDAEIAAIKAFAERGGTIVVAGWSDLYENYTGIAGVAEAEHMSGQQNKLLAALGSKLRISDDGSTDATMSTDSTNRRLFFDTYNFENPLAEGIVQDPDHKQDNTFSQLYSHYGGATIYAVDTAADAAAAPATTLPASVNPLVFAHTTTSSSDHDSDGTVSGQAKAVTVPMYSFTDAYADAQNRHLITATEELTHANGKTSLIVVSGAAFMSNFEIQYTLDNAAELVYSNYTILENLIEYSSPVEPTPIADLHTAEMGERFIVEGIVTSNASGFDKDTAFFDCIYVQDETGGINAFPVAGDYRVGQKVRLNGTVSAYQGETQLNVKSIKMLNSDHTDVGSLAIIVPKTPTTKEVANGEMTGWLVKVEGTVVDFDTAENLVQTILVRDASGYDVRVFIDGYIDTDGDAALQTALAVGKKVTVTGLASYDNTFDGQYVRIRIRERSDIVVAAAETPAVGVSTAVPSNPTKGFVNWEGADDGAFMIDGVSFELPQENTSVVDPITYTVPVSGTLAYREGFIGFWPDNKAMQEGNYLGLRLTLPVYTGGNAVLTMVGADPEGGNKVISAADGTTAGGNYYYDFIYRVASINDTYTIIVDYDGAGSDYLPVTYVIDCSSLTLTGKYVPPSGGSSGTTTPMITPNDLIEKDGQVSIAITDKKNTLNEAAEEKAVELNAEKDIVIEGNGLTVVIPAGTLGKGDSVNDMLVNPGQKGNVIQVTDADGNKTILPISIVDNATASYIANRPGSYAIIENIVTFPDVASDHWAAEAIGFAANRGLFIGTDTGEFNAAEPMTRGMLVTVLARLANGSSKNAPAFADVASDAWYAGAVAWASENKIVEGDGTNFYPDTPVTREQLCTILVRFMDFTGLTLPEITDEVSFEDSDLISDWAADAVIIAAKAGLISGKPGGLVDPAGTASRAEIATILQRFIEGILK